APGDLRRHQQRHPVRRNGPGRRRTALRHNVRRRRRRLRHRVPGQPRRRVYESRLVRRRQRLLSLRPVITRKRRQFLRHHHLRRHQQLRQRLSHDPCRCRHQPRLLRRLFLRQRARKRVARDNQRHFLRHHRRRRPGLRRHPLSALCSASAKISILHPDKRRAHLRLDLNRRPVVSCAVQDEPRSNKLDQSRRHPQRHKFRHDSLRSHHQRRSILSRPDASVRREVRRLCFKLAPARRLAYSILPKSTNGTLMTTNKIAHTILRLSAALLSTSIALAQTPSSAAGGAGEYHVSQTFHIGGEGSWDYLTVDPEHKLLFVPRTTHTMVLDANTGKTVADIPGQKRNHCVALVPGAGRGFISDGTDASVTVFDLKTYAVLGKVKTVTDSDGIIYDSASDKVLVVSGDNGVLIPISPNIDLATGKADPAIELGGAPEFLAADGKGKVFINLMNKDQVAVVDTKAMKVVDKWSVNPGGSP